MPEKAVGVGDGPREGFMVVCGTQKDVGESEDIVDCPRRMQNYHNGVEHAAIAFLSQTNTNPARDTLCIVLFLNNKHKL